MLRRAVELMLSIPIEPFTTSEETAAWQTALEELAEFAGVPLEAPPAPAKLRRLPEQTAAPVIVAQLRRHFARVVMGPFGPQWIS